MSKDLGDKIKALRTAKKLTLEQLADKCESSKGYIWEIENRGTRKPSGEKLMKIAQALETTTEYLLDNSGTSSEADAADMAFFRKYQNMPDKTKQKIRKSIDLLWEDED